MRTPSALRARTLEAFHSIPRRGAEIGGLLFGRVLRTDPLLARITGFEEVPIEHRFGPSYVFSDEDHAYLAKALQRERPEPVIGFFRSYTGREMLLDEADRNLLTRYFSHPRSLFLLLEPRASAADRGGGQLRGGAVAGPQGPQWAQVDHRRLGFVARLAGGATRTYRTAAFWAEVSSTE